MENMEYDSLLLEKINFTRYHKSKNKVIKVRTIWETMDSYAISYFYEYK